MSEKFAFPEPTVEFSRRGKVLVAARVVWWITLLVTAVVFILALPARYSQFISPEDEIRDGLTRLGYSAQYIEQYGSEAALQEAVSPLGLSSAGYASLFLALEVLVALVYVFVGLLVAWRKFDDLFGIFVSLFLIVYGVGGSSFMVLALVVQHWTGFVLGGLVSFLAYSLLPPFFCLFPDGRWVPRWGWLPTGIWFLFTFLWNFAPSSPLNPTNWPLWLYVLTTTFVWGSLPVAQIYRYRKISSPAQRQQTKWLVFGIGAVFMLLVVPAVLVYVIIPSFVTETFFSLLIPYEVILMGIIPIALGISILRYRLWDIDILIRRTLQYSLLTGLLALTYFGGVVILQGILSPFTGQENSPFVTVITTLAIAALFNPLRRRVQDFIDQRFYRKKYNAEQALAQFATIARDEVDMDKLTTALLGVVQETMQPEKVTVWLINTKERS